MYTNYFEKEGAHEAIVQREWEDTHQFEQKKFAATMNGELLELDPEANHKFENSPIEEQKQESSAEKEEESQGEDGNLEQTDYSELLKISQEVKKKD